MVGNFPSRADVFFAIDLYLIQAYGRSPLPAAVAALIRSLHSAGDWEFFSMSAWERDGSQPPGRLSLRLGNRRYPHMKLVLQRRPDGLGYIWRVDPHDRHVLVPTSAADCDAFGELMHADEQMALKIESTWESQGLPTVKTFMDSQARMMESEAVALT